jgi:hypothetical protein
MVVDRGEAASHHCVDEIGPIVRTMRHHTYRTGLTCSALFLIAQRERSKRLDAVTGTISGTIGQNQLARPKVLVRQ